jgi:hypothetical protein
VIISINGGSWEGNGCLARDKNLGNWQRWHQKGGWKEGLGKGYGGCWILWPLCLSECISAVVVEGVCVRNYKSLGICMVSTVG